MKKNNLNIQKMVLPPKKESGRNGECRLSGGVIFDNLITFNELLEMLKRQYSKKTIYKWVSQGMPHKKIKGKLWFPKNDVVLWLERS